MNAKLQSRSNCRKAGSMKSEIDFITTRSRTLAICSGLALLEPGFLIAWARSLLNMYVPALRSALISERFSSSLLLKALIVTLSSPRDSGLRFEISFHALRRDSLSEMVRSAEVEFISRSMCRRGDTTDTGGILYGVA